ncbi:MAG: hypothetical protein WBL91_24265, partial [Pseudolabrys sp.]
MRRITVLSVAAAVTVAVAITSFILSRTLAVREPIAKVTSAQVAEPTLITGTLSSRQAPMQVQVPSSSAPPVASLASAAA